MRFAAVRSLAAAAAAAAAVVVSAPVAHANVPYQGGPVLHSNRTHVIFWQPAGSGLTFDPGYAPLIERFLSQVAADSRKPTNLFGLTGQYRDSGGPAAYVSTFGGATVDVDPLPPNGCAEPPLTSPGWGICLTDAQLESELEHVVAVDRLPTGANDVDLLVTPNGFGSCTDSSSTQCALGGSAGGYCGYHSSTLQGILYAVIPYNAVSGHCESGNPRPNSSTADPAVSTISHEQVEMVTDPEGDAWIDSDDNEIADLCTTRFGPSVGGAGARAWNEVIDGGHYYLQEVWSNQNRSCQPRPRPDRTWFTVSAHPRATKPVSFWGRASDPGGAIVAYDWFFGDGHTARHARVSHAFKRPGRYRVVLRTTDSSGNYAYWAKTVKVQAAAGA